MRETTTTTHADAVKDSAVSESLDTWAGSLGVLRPRACGNCQACCTSMRIAELDKPQNTRCPNQCPTGCAIYPTRPESCGKWSCLWLLGETSGEGIFRNMARPDRCGVILHAEDGKVYAVEVSPGSMLGHEAQRVLAYVRRRAKFLTLCFADGTRREERRPLR